MIHPFRPDLFSVKGPAWVPAPEEVARTAGGLLASAGYDLVPAEPPRQAKGLELNSSNLRLATHRGELVVKRWSAGADPNATMRTLELMEWLSMQGIPIPTPIRLNETLLSDHGGSRWSAFTFATGTWFAGTGDEPRAAATASGMLAATLARIPASLTPVTGPTHLSDADDEALRRTGAERASWPAVLGEVYAAALAAAWHDVMDRWDALRADPPYAGAALASHYDLHPHNVLMHDGETAAILDFEACGTMPFGYAMAFAALKQGRQTVVAQGGSADPCEVGAAFLANFRAAWPEASAVTRIGDLAVAEILRRIVLILRLNFERRLATWNAVLPVQLAHLQEARLLFT